MYGIDVEKHRRFGYVYSIYDCSHKRTRERWSNFININLHTENVYTCFVKPKGLKHNSKG